MHKNKVLFLCSFLFLLCGTVYSTDTSSVKLTYKGVEIVTYNQRNMFPESWLEEPRYGRSLPLEICHETRAIEIIKSALDKYPEAMLKSNLKKIYLLGSLQFYGLSYGGTYYDNKIYLCVKDSTLGYDAKYIEKALHHEFSSILLKNYSFDEGKWESANHSEFSYGDGGIEALKSGSVSLDFDPSYNRQGFLNQYSIASLEEDFNEVCSSLFMSSKRFWDIAEYYPRVMKKVRMAIDFYSKINPVFTEEYFEGLAQ